MRRWRASGGCAVGTGGQSPRLARQRPRFPKGACGAASSEPAARAATAACAARSARPQPQPSRGDACPERGNAARCTRRAFVAGRARGSAGPASRSTGAARRRPSTVDARRDAGRRRAHAARLVHGDALDVARALAREGLAGKVDLVYVDPPFALAGGVRARGAPRRPGRRARRAHARRTTTAGTQSGSASTSTCSRRGSRRSRGCSSPAGTIWVHVDWRASYLVRVAPRRDPRARRVRERDRLAPRAEPRPAGGEPPVRSHARHARRLRHARGAKLVPPTRLEPIEPAAIRRDERGRPFTTRAARRLHRRVDRAPRARGARAPDGERQGLHQVLPREGRRRDAWCRERRVDALWTDVPPLRHARAGERTGFPTQKPRALLDRIVACATPPGGLVVDVFAGSGTTGESAHALGRARSCSATRRRSRSRRRGRGCSGPGVPLAVQSVRRRVRGRGGAGGCAAGARGACTAGASAPSVTRRAARARASRWRGRSTAPSTRAGPFRAAWHSERAPGREGDAGGARGDARARRRGPARASGVWYDDGRVGHAIEVERR